MFSRISLTKVFFCFDRIKDQIDVVQPGQTIIVRNGKVDMYKGFMRLAVDKWGKLEKAPTPASFEVNEKNNLSAVEYELVNVDE